ncbi:TIGR02679 domain-containing protein [Streptomyces sp. NPDC052309]|uniref:TIGR02679 domain-containing protein n=1 Tax=Streptomyces sp. NPDC052309 TaxID=3155421 RepID=UPI0034280625
MAREKPLTGTVTLTAPTDVQRRAAERLLGRGPREGGSLTVRLEDVDAVLRRSGVSPDGLAAAVTALTGRVDLIAEQKAREARAWEQAYSPLRLLGPDLAEWTARVTGNGQIRRLARTPETAHALLENAVKALSALPAEPAVSVAAFAAQILGDAHALDDGRPLTTVVRSGIHALTGIEEEKGARRQREAWVRWGS